MNTSVGSGSEILNHVPGIFFRAGKDNVISFTYVSDGCLAITGYQSVDLKNGGATDYIDIVRIDDRDRVCRERELCLKNNAKYCIEYHIDSRLGHGVLVRETAMPYYGIDGAPEGIEGFIENINLEKDYRHLQQSFTSYQDAINIGSVVTITDLQMHILFANELFCKVSGYSKAELLGKEYKIIESPQHTPDFFSEIWEFVRKGGIWRNEVCNVSKTGDLFWLDQTVSPLYNETGAIESLLSVSKDITDRKNKEEFLRLSVNEIGYAASISQAILRSDSLQQISTLLLDVLNERLPLELSRVYTWKGSISTLDLVGESIGAGLQFEVESASDVDLQAYRPNAARNNLVQEVVAQKNSKFVTSYEEINLLIDSGIESQHLNEAVSGHAKSGKIKTIGALPLIEGNEVIGLIILISSRLFTTSELQFLHRFSHHAAAAMAKKKSDLALIEREEYNAGILASLNAEIAVVDQSGKIISVNEKWRRFSIENGEVNLNRTCEGTNYFDACRAAVQAGDIFAIKAVEGLKAVLNNDLLSFTLEYPCHSAEKERWFLLNISRFELGNAGAVLRHNDITERKKAERTIEDQNGEIKSIYDATPDAVIVIDNNLEIVRWDKKCENLFGWQEQEVLGIRMAELLLPERARENHYRLTSQYITTGVGDFLGKSFDIKTLHKDGRELDVVFHVTSIMHNGKPGFIGFIRDISARKLNECLLKESEVRYRNLFERNLAGVYRADMNDVILECNDAFANIIGFKSAAEVAGKPARQLYENIGIASFISKVASNSGKIVNHESLIRTKAGNFVYLLENAYLQEGRDGKPEFMEGTIVDITTRKETEFSLYKSKQLYKNLLNNMNDGFLVDNAAGKVTFVNERFCQFFGMAEDDIDKLELEDYIAPEYRVMLRDRHNRRIAGEDVPDTFECEGLRKDGKRIWLEVKVIPIQENGLIVGTQSVIRDITEKKIRETEFEKLADLNSKIIDSSDELFYVIEIRDQTSNSNPLVYVSNKTREFYGIEPEELMENGDIWLKSMHPDDVGLVVEHTKSLMSSKLPSARVYRSRNALTGEYNWFYDFVKPVLNEDGSIKEIFGSIKNITESKNKEQELKKTVAELNDKFNELMQFNYIVSHNLRGPIADILGLANVLNLPNIKDEDRQVIIHNIEASTIKMDVLIRDLNDILSNRSAINTHKTVVSIPQVIYGILDTLERQIQEAQATINTDIPVGMKEIFAIKSYLESIFYNLISNALKYKEPTRLPQIFISVRREGSSMVIKVSDNGLGIDLNKHGKYVFGLYKRFHLQLEGKGLGLHMTKTQIESMGGKIEIESAPGVGTTFIVTLPDTE